MVAMRKYLNPSTKAVVTDASKEFSASEKKTIVFHDVSYTLKKGKTIKSSISGIAKSGEITAIMGPSGAGESSLIDVLSMRTMTGIRSGTTGSSNGGNYIYNNPQMTGLPEPVKSKLLHYFATFTLFDCFCFNNRNV